MILRKINGLTFGQILAHLPRKLKNLARLYSYKVKGLSRDFKRHMTPSEGRLKPKFTQLLMCPHCRGSLKITNDVVCVLCGRQFKVNYGVPIIIDKPGDYINRNSYSYTRTNPYSDETIKIIKNHQHGVVLDFGAGFPPEENIFENVLRMDIICYPTTSLVANTHVIPLQDNSIDAFISESVLEHVPDPFHFAREAHRVLKPGGVIRIDTAFLQPYHHDPDNYFNMSLAGIRQVFKDFEEIDAGVANYQRASYTINLILKAYAEWVPDKKVKKLIEQVLALPIDELDDTIPNMVHQALAAGVYFQGRKKK